MEIYEKIETAIAAYLAAYVGADPELSTDNWPPSLRNSAGVLRIFTGESEQLKDGQAILVIAEDSNQEDPQFTDNQHVPVQIWLRTPTTVLTAKQIEALQKTAIQNHSAAASVLSDAIGIDPFDLARAFNAAGADFTIMGGVMDLKPMRQEPANYFASGWSFRVYAMNKTAP